MTSGNGHDQTHARFQRLEEMTEEMHATVTLKMDELIGSVREVGDKVQGMNGSVQVIASQNDKFIKWLLWVVCAIALGTKLLELIKGFQIPH